MMTIDELSAKWNSISPFSGGFLLVADDNSLSFHIGYQGDNQKCFMVLNSGKVDNLVSSKAIRVDCVPLSGGGCGLRFLLLLASLDELFIKLCWDLINASSNTPDPVAKVVSQYRSWMRLLQQAGNGIMDASRQKGLLGEMLFLSSAVDEYGSKEALQSWTGPEGSDQDYNFSDRWVEVKTVSIAADQVSVSSLQQLDRSDYGNLIVFFMDKTSSHGAKTISLPEAVASIIGKLCSDEEKDLFACKLAKYGYLEKDAASYAETRYQLAEKRQYSITPDFPRLTRGNTPTGIIKAEYSIDLAIIDPFIR